MNHWPKIKLFGSLKIMNKTPSQLRLMTVDL
jgi:hypothetical protein